jgi:hypothetical protein
LPASNTRAARSINIDETWGPGTHCVSGNITVSAGVLLTIQPGAVVKFGNGLELRVYGSLNAEGSESDQIVMTSKNDDSVGEIMAGSTSMPAAGDWDGIFLDCNSTNQGIGEFDHCRIRYGGYADGAVDSNVVFYLSDSGYFANSISEYSALDGIRVESSNPAVINATMVNNSRYGLYCSNCSSPVLNSILWYNLTEQIYSNVSDQPEAGYSDIQGGYPGDGNIDTDPLFADMSQGNYLLQQCSPCIDKGDPAEVLVADYKAGELVIAVDNVTHVEPGDLLWIVDAVNMESGAVTGASSTSITAANFGNPDCHKQSGE